MALRETPKPNMFLRGASYLTGAGLSVATVIGGVACGGGSDGGSNQVVHAGQETGQENNNCNDSRVPDGWRTFHADGVYEISYPDGWQTIKDDRQLILGHDPSISVTRYEFQDNETVMDEFMQGMIDEIVYNNGGLINEADLQPGQGPKIACEDTISLIYTRPDNNDQKIIRYFLQDGRTVWEFSAYLDAGDTQQNEAIFEQSIDSFKFTTQNY